MENLLIERMVFSIKTNHTNQAMHLRLLAFAFLAMSSTSPAIDFSPLIGANTDALPEVKRLHAGGYLNAIAWDTTGSRLAGLASFGSRVVLWDTKSWTQLNAFERISESYAFNSLAFTADGDLLTSAPGGHQPSDPKYAQLIDPKYPSLGIFSLVRWNPETGKTVGYIPNLGYPPQDFSTKLTNVFAASRDGLLVAGLRSRAALLYDTKTGSLLRKLKVEAPPSSVAFSPNGKELAVGSIDGKLHVFSIDDGSTQHDLQLYPIDTMNGQGVKMNSYHCVCIAYSPDGTLIATGKYRGSDFSTPSSTSVDIWKISDWSLVASLENSTHKNQDDKDQASTPWSLSWSPDGKLLAIGDEKSLNIWNVTSGSQTSLYKKSISRGVYSLAFSPTGLLAITDNSDIVVYQPTLK